MRWYGFILTLALCAVVLEPAWARGPRGPWAPPRERPGRVGAKTPIDEFERMSPQQQQRALDRLPPGQRQKLQERLAKFNRLPPEQQQTLRNLYNRLHQLPPERQNAVRNAINRFSEQPAERQQALREELRGMAALPEQDREARMSSRDFKGRLSGKEQGIVRDMTPLLPNR
jgi:hypothetical protein